MAMTTPLLLYQDRCVSDRIFFPIFLSVFWLLAVALIFFLTPPSFFLLFLSCFVLQVYWDKYSNNVDETVDSLGLYAARYANHPALFGFALLNEPIVNVTVLQNYYQMAYKRVRLFSPDSVIVINPLISPFQSGTEPEWTGFMNPNAGYERVWMDLHFYSCFGGPADQTNADAAIAYIRNDRQAQVNQYKSVNPKPMFVGEWSGCGHFNTSRTGDFVQAQMQVYGTAGEFVTLSRDI